MNNLTYFEKIIYVVNYRMSNIIVLLDMLLDKKIVMSQEDEKSALRLIQESAEKIVRLMKMLSSATYLDNKKIKFYPVKTNLIQLIENQITFIKYRKDKRINIAFNKEIKNCEVDIDPFWFEQAIINLIISAACYTKNEIIEISLDIVKKDAVDHISLNITGIDRYNHIKTEIGSSASLDIANEILDGHRGRLSLSNNCGSTTFMMTLPYIISSSDYETKTIAQDAVLSSPQ